MIVREAESHFVMTPQHEHARFAGQLAQGFREDLFVDRAFRQDVLLAIQEHDRGWIRLDDTPIWNDRDGIPYSFVDYPLLPKLALYRVGLDEVENMNEYAALLCSLHYSSFHHLRHSTLPDCIHFIAHETERQERLKARLGHPPDEIMAAHYRLLKLCDRISLYVCLNEPGVTKEREDPRYKEGFGIEMEKRNVTAEWISDHEIAIQPDLFDQDAGATLKSKRVAKSLIRQVGLAEAYRQTDWLEREVTFRSGGSSAAG